MTGVLKSIGLNKLCYKSCLILNSKYPILTYFDISGLKRT